MSPVHVLGAMTDRPAPTGRTWTCQRQTAGKKCRHVNPARLRKCVVCGKARPAKRKPAHTAALDESYEAFLALNDGIEKCAICDRPPGERRLHRDHSHATGMPRGLLCMQCNRALSGRREALMTPQWLRRAAYYLERHVERQEKAA